MGTIHSQAHPTPLVLTTSATTTTKTATTVLTSFVTSTKTVDKSTVTVTTATTSVIATKTVQPSGPPSSLDLSVTMPSLPADGATYPALIISLSDVNGNPSQAPYAINITLTSSDNSIALVSQLVTIHLGKNYGIANMTTTHKPGTTTITALAPAFASSSIGVETATPSGIPASVSLAALPNSTIAGSSTPIQIVAELLDINGLPAPAPSNTPISFSSSSPALGTFQSSTVVIPPGQEIGVVNFTPGQGIGTDILTATGSGLVSGAVRVGVLPALLSLQLVAEPSSIATGATGLLVVSLTDAGGNAVLAPYGISITLGSSQSSVASVPGSLVIPTGAQYVDVQMSAGALPGSATITASGTGLTPARVQITVTAPGSPAELALSVGPSPGLANGQNSATIMVSIETATGASAVTPTSITVYLSSSNPLVGSVPTSVTIPSNSSFTTAAFASTQAGGHATITATAENLGSVDSLIVTTGPGAGSVQLEIGQSVLPADGGTYPGFTLVMVDSSGAPTPTPAALVFDLASSNSSVGTVPLSVTIPAGGTSAAIPVVTSSAPGSLTLTATNPSIGKLSSQVATASVAHPKLFLLASPQMSLATNGGTSILLLAEIVNGAGDPVPASQSIQISINAASTGSAVSMASQQQLTVMQGHEVAYTSVLLAGRGTISLTASAPGFVPVAVSLAVLPVPVQASIRLSASNIYNNANASITVTVLYLNSPFVGATVSMSATSGKITPPSENTNSLGQATFTFEPSGIGSVNLVANVANGAFGNLTTTSSIGVTAAPIPPPPSFLQQYGLYLVVLVVVVIAAAAVWVYLSRRRRIRALLGEQGQP
jgi:hypothetical protein